MLVFWEADFVGVFAAYVGFAFGCSLYESFSLVGPFNDFEGECFGAGEIN